MEWDGWERISELLGILIAAFMAYSARWHASNNAGKVDDIHQKINSRMDELLESVRAAAIAKGRHDLHEEQKRDNPPGTGGSGAITNPPGA